jgi:hypothetical protein
MLCGMIPREVKGPMTAARGGDAQAAEGSPEGERFARIFEARWKALQGDTTNREIAARLTRLLGRRIDEARVSEWRNGRHIPSAIVLLALVEASDQSIDAALFGGSVSATLQRLEESIERLSGQLAEAETEDRLRREAKALRRKGADPAADPESGDR